MHWVGSKIPEPKVSAVARMVMKQTLGKGWKVGSGLGKNLSGVLEPPAVIEKRDRYGLGYRPTEKDKERFRQQNQERVMKAQEYLQILLSRSHGYGQQLKGYGIKEVTLSKREVLEEIERKL